MFSDFIGEFVKLGFFGIPLSDTMTERGFNDYGINTAISVKGNSFFNGNSCGGFVKESILNTFRTSEVLIYSVSNRCAFFKRVNCCISVKGSAFGHSDRLGSRFNGFFNISDCLSFGGEVCIGWVVKVGGRYHIGFVGWGIGCSFTFFRTMIPMTRPLNIV